MYLVSVHLIISIEKTYKVCPLHILTYKYTHSQPIYKHRGMKYSLIKIMHV